MWKVDRSCKGRREMWAYIFENNFSPFPGEVLALFGGPESLTDLAATYDFVMRFIRDPETGNPVYSNYVHLWPSQVNDRDIPTEFRDIIEQEAKEDEASPECTDRYLESVHFVPVDTCDSDNLIKALEDIQEGSSIYVHCAESYRFSDVQLTPRAISKSVHGNSMGMGLAEDFLSNHAQRLVQDALRVAKEKQSIIVLSFESYGFSGGSIPEALKDEDSFAMITMKAEDSQSRFRAAFRYCLDNVDTMTVEGIRERLAVEEDPGVGNTLCMATVLVAKGLPGLGWQSVQPFFNEILESSQCAHVLMGAQIAFVAGKGDAAANLLKQATKLDPHELELLATLHTLTEYVHGRNNAKEVLDRLHARFPNHPATKAKCLLFYLSNREFALARDLAVDLSEDYLVALCDAFYLENLPVKAFLETACSMGEKEAALHDIAKESIRRGRYGAAWRFLRGCRPSENIIALQTEVFGHRILRRGVTDASVDDLAGIISYVAHNPGQLESRHALDRLIEDDLEYYTAVVLLVTMMEREVSRLYEITRRATGTHECEWIKNSSLQSEPEEKSIELVMEAIKAQPRNSALLPGEGAFPECLKQMATHKVLYDWLHWLHHDKTLLMDEYRDTRTLLLHVICQISAHLNDPTSDGLAFRHLVVMNWLTGHLQEARDMAETALMALPVSQPNFREWRLALGWLCLAEAFQRSQNPLGCLLQTVLCLMAVGDSIPSMKGAKDIFRMCSRVMRDIRMYPLAMKYLQYERDLMEKHQIDAAFGYQLDQMEHSIRSNPTLGQGSVAELQSLVQEGCDFLRAEHDPQPFPMLSTLAALISRIRQMGDEIKESEWTVFEDHVGRAPEGVRSTILSQVESTPTEETLRTLAQRVGNANSLDDLAFQGRPLRIVAERAIARAFEVRDVPLYLLASGILAQPGLSMALNIIPQDGLDQNTVNKWLYQHVGGEAASPEQIKDTISLTKSGLNANRVSFSETLTLDVQSVFSAFLPDETATILSRDNTGKLYALPIAQNGNGEVRCLSPEYWHPAKHREWSRIYPYAYGKWGPVSNPFLTEKPTPQEVRDSLEGLEPDVWSPDKHNIVIPDAGLYGFPFNLVPCGDQFAGEQYRISCSPSLSWLSTTRAATKMHDSRRMAWMGVPGKRDFGLEIFVNKTKDALVDHAVTICQEDRPKGMSESSLVVVSAHGGIGQWGQFTSITSDKKILFSPQEFSRFFVNCGCVVLLICSAGRSDEKQHSGEVCSLVTELFANGVQSVVAPVWPLNIDVAALWLPEFLNRFTAGEKVVDATFSAARIVEGQYPNPCAWAAMHVYGDGNYSQNRTL